MSTWQVEMHHQKDVEENDQSKAVVNVLRLQRLLKAELLKPGVQRKPLPYYINLLHHLDEIIPTLDGVLSDDEKIALNQGQVDLKRIPFESPEESKDHEVPEKIPQMATRSKLAPPDVKKNTRNKSADETTSAENIQTLLLQQKDMSALELEEERRNQYALVTELSELTSVLKENTLEMSRAVIQQNKQLDSIHTHAEQNVMELEEQKNKLSKQQKAQVRGFWATVWIMITVLLSFAGTYIIMRLFPKPRY